MNREIKFRVWDKYKKCWLEKSESLHLFSEYFLTLDGEIRRFDGAISKNDDDEIFYTQSVESVFDSVEKKNWEPKERFIIQEFINLKDKNGKEIYEGDILESKYQKATISGVVEWDEKLAAFVFVCVGGKFYLSKVVIEMNVAGYSIIGNIFENPDILPKINLT